MTLTGLIILLLIAGIVGALGQMVSGRSIGGFLVSIILGFVGAYVGIWMAAQLGLPEIFTITVDGETFPIVWAIIGAAVITFLVSLMTRRA